MSGIPVLWPKISVDAVTPVALLRVQATSLEKVTQGILLGTVTYRQSGSEEQIFLEVIAPALGSKVRIVTVSHRQNAPYPATVKWQKDRYVSTSKSASTHEELEDILRHALGSPGVVSSIHSLIARSNDIGKDNGAEPEDGSTADASGANESDDYPNPELEEDGSSSVAEDIHIPTD